MLENCDVIVIFLIFVRFGAIQKPDSWRIVCKIYIFINSNLLSYKNWKQLKNLKHSAHNIALSKGAIFAKKMLMFCKNCWHQQNM